MTLPIPEAAKAIIDEMRAMYSKPLAMVVVKATDFPHLDMAAYGRARADLEARGFRYLGDVEFPDVSNAPRTFYQPTMVRNFVSRDGSILAAYYQMRPRMGRVILNWLSGLLTLRWISATTFVAGLLPTRHCYDFETEFTDGSFLVTSNVEAAGRISNPPTIESVFFPFGTAAGLVLKAHERRLDERSQPVAPVDTLEDAQRFSQRMMAVKGAYRASVQWVTRAEMRALSPSNRLADEVFAEVQKQLGSSRQ